MRVILITLFFSVAVAQQSRAYLKEFASGNHLFTASVYKELSKNGTGNILISPLSVEIVLALSQSGAKDETKEEIRSSLHLPSAEEKIRSSFKSLLTNFQNNKNYKLCMANKMYVDKRFPVEEGFKEVATDFYRADLENVDFSRKNESANIINQWVEKQTENKIQNLIDPTKLHDETVIILVNTLFFRGRWESIFDKELTTKSKFYKTNNDVVDVDTMYINEQQYGYYESQELKAKFLEMYFHGGQVTMTIVLPNDKEGLPALESNIEQVLTSRRFTFALIDLALPKFKIESQTDFKVILQKLGVNKAFSIDADFSEISGHKGGLYISNVIQKAFIDVNEEGVEATAATEVEMVLGASFSRPKKFIVDHPFIYYIKAKDVILFVGRVTNPKY